ncbi:unnamed protein product, partial [Polarella glacialis]
LSIKKDWFEQISRVGKGTQESKLAIARAKAAIHKVRDSAKKELFDKAKVRLLELLESSPGPAAVADAEKLVVDLEAKAEPFTRFKKGPESEMMPLADQVDSSAEAAKASVASAKELLRPVEEDVFDEMIKADVQAFLSGETRRSEVRLGQLGRRIDRCTNLSSQYRSGLDKYRIVALIEELKPLILQKVKDSSGVDVEEVAAAIKEAEKQVELSKKVATLSMEEAIELSDKMEQAIEAAKASMAGARQQLCPIDESLDPVVQKALKAFVAAEVKGSEQKLGLQEMKLRRVVNLNTTFRADIAKKKAAKVDQVRTAALKIIRLFREGRSLEDLFGLFEPGDGDLIDESKFLTFFEKSDTMLKAIGVEPPTEEKPSAEELAALFASSCPEGSSSLTKDSFISLVAAYLQVVKKTNLTEGVSVMKSAVVRDLVVGELLEVIDGPTFEEQIKVNRLKVKAKSDGAIGWATMAGNAGTVFLKVGAVYSRDFFCASLVWQQQTHQALHTCRTSQWQTALSLSDVLETVHHQESGGNLHRVVMMVGNDFEGYLQVSAPSGFDWLATLVYLRPGAPWNATTNFTEFPANVSSDTQGSMLKFQRGNFTGGVRYGFEGPIYVPNFGPVTSNPTFTFTLDKAVKKGPAFPEGMSSVVFAEPVRAIVDGFVMASNRLAGVRTQLLIKVRLATDVAAPHTVRITPPPGYTTSEPNGGCTMRPWPGKLDFSPDEDVLSQATCGWERVDVEKDQYRLILYPNKRTPLTQLLQFRVNAFNPVVNKSAPGPKTVSLGPCGAPQCWSFESKTFFSEEDIDSPQFVDAIPSPEPMEQAALMPFRMPMRNDQPGKASRIVLYFKLGMAGGFKDKEQLPRGIMELNAPPGTKFPQSCAYTIETRRVVIFGSVYNASVLEVDDWEQPAEIISCVGSNERAVIEIDAGLRADKGYAFVIGLTNPLVDAAESNWTIQFQGQFSRPFPTYKLWAFSDLAVEPFVKSSGPSCYQGQCVGAGAGVAVPVVVTVRTQNSIGTAGELHITAPLGFAFDATEGGTKIDGDRPTGCIIREYVGGNLSAAPERWRALERDCLI